MVFQDGFKDKEGRVWLVGRDLMGGGIQILAIK